MRQWEEFTELFYGVPIGTYHETRKFRPQVRLFFKEDAEDVEEHYRPLNGELTFRLMSEKSETITKAELTSIANKIKNAFVKPKPFRWHKGKVLCSYNDPEKGYKLQVYAFTKADGKDVISKVLDCQSHTPQWEKLTVNENDDPSSAYPTIPPNKSILTKTYRQPRKRPSGYVRFQYATCQIWGITRLIPLIDRTFRFLDPLVDLN